MMQQWIWQDKNWPHFSYDQAEVLRLLSQVRQKQGELLGRSGIASESEQAAFSLDVMLQNIITSNAIEGETLNVGSVRSSLAKRLLPNMLLKDKTSEQSEGLAKLLLDAVENTQQDLKLERLLTWHRWLFASASSSIYDIEVGALRDETPMQVVSGREGRYKVHFEAPPRQDLDLSLAHFIEWFNTSKQDKALDPLIRAGICHFWFITLHPFEDGNGRITRTLTDLALQQDNAQSIRLYAMSASILDNRKSYYQILEQCQRGDLDITAWLVWFLETLQQAINFAIKRIDKLLFKARFWLKHQQSNFNKEQIKVLNRLLDGGPKGFEQGLSAAKYQAVTKVSKATATRHLGDLVNKGCLEKLAGGGRSTRYQLAKL